MKRILIVEDNVGVGNVIAACLASYDVTVMHNGPEALARASQLSACDLLITDYLMPSIPGDEVARRLRLMHPAAKTMLLTGFGRHHHGRSIGGGRADGKALRTRRASRHREEFNRRPVGRGLSD